MSNYPGPKIILAVGAHPDDIDIGCAGSVAKWTKEGQEVYYLVLTDGSKGSENHQIPNEQLIKIRRREQQKAAGLLRVKQVIFLDFIDGELENSLPLRKQIVTIIRRIKPTMVICFDPSVYYDEERMMVNHPDHRQGGEAVMDCVYPFARNARSFPELLEEGLGPHVVEELLLVNFSKANYFVDISSSIDKKLAALSCHKSQFQDVEKFGERIRQMSKLMGQKARLASTNGSESRRARSAESRRAKPKMKFAEAFVRIRLVR